MADIFISYSSTDKTIVKKIASLLERKGWSVWWDRQIPIGTTYDSVIETEIQNARCVIVVWTERSVKSEWVKNEASEAFAKQKMVPMVLENVTIPLAFRRIESAMLIDWKGEEDHPELEILYSSITHILGKDSGIVHPVAPTPRTYRNTILVIAGMLASLILLFIYLQQQLSITRGIFFFLLLLFAGAIAISVFGVVKSVASLRNQTPSFLQKLMPPVAGLLAFTAGAIFLTPGPSEKNFAIRLFDRNKNPITQGEVKIYLPEYIRSQSVDNVGQALFTGIPANTFNNKMKIEISSPGYAGRTFDTLLRNSKTLNISLSLSPVIFISGKVKTAAELPIRGVEINVDGTKYYAMSVTDGSYNLRLEEYTLGDEVTITTSHKDFEDKTFSLRIQSPNMQGQDIFLNPLIH